MNLDSSDLLIAILAALVGAAGTYYASIYVARKAEKDLVLRLHCILLFEITSHQIYLEKQIDDILPAWIRFNPYVDREGLTQFEPHCVISEYHYSTSYFQTYLEQLVHSGEIVSIANYYEHIKNLNSYSEYFKEIEFGDASVGYINKCFELVRASADATNALLSTDKIESEFTELLKNRIAQFKHTEVRYKLFQCLRGTKWEELLAYE